MGEGGLAGAVAEDAVRPSVAGRAINESATELGFPGPTLGKMQSKAAGRTGEPPGHREEASSEGFGGPHLLAQTDACGTASEVIRHHLDGQPGAVGGEAAWGEMVESPHPAATRPLSVDSS